MKTLGECFGTVLCMGDEAVRLNLRSSFLRKNGWQVLSSGAAHEGIIRFGQEKVDAAILDFDDAAQEALVAGELKRLRPQVPVILLVPDDKVLAEDVLQCADIVVPRSDESCLRSALESLRPDTGNT